MNKLSTLDWVGLVLVLVGGLNWGLVGAFDYNLVDSIFGMGSTIAMIVYVLVGLASLWWIFMAAKLRKA